MNSAAMGPEAISEMSTCPPVVGPPPVPLDALVLPAVLEGPPLELESPPPPVVVPVPELHAAAARTTAPTNVPRRALRFIAPLYFKRGREGTTSGARPRELGPHPHQRLAQP